MTPFVDARSLLGVVKTGNISGVTSMGMGEDGSHSQSSPINLSQFGQGLSISFGDAPSLVDIISGVTSIGID